MEQMRFRASNLHVPLEDGKFDAVFFLGWVLGGESLGETQTPEVCFGKGQTQDELEPLGLQEIRLTCNWHAFVNRHLGLVDLIGSCVWVHAKEPEARAASAGGDRSLDPPAELEPRLFGGSVGDARGQKFQDPDAQLVSNGMEVVADHSFSPLSCAHSFKSSFGRSESLFSCFKRPLSLLGGS